MRWLQYRWEPALWDSTSGREARASFLPRRPARFYEPYHLEFCLSRCSWRKPPHSWKSVMSCRFTARSTILLTAGGGGKLPLAPGFARQYLKLPERRRTSSTLRRAWSVAALAAPSIGVWLQA